MPYTSTQHIAFVVNREHLTCYVCSPHVGVVTAVILAHDVLKQRSGTILNGYFLPLPFPLPSPLLFPSSLPLFAIACHLANNKGSEAVCISRSCGRGGVVIHQNCSGTRGRAEGVWTVRGVVRGRGRCDMMQFIVSCFILSMPCVHHHPLHTHFSPSHPLPPPPHTHTTQVWPLPERGWSNWSKERFCQWSDVGFYLPPHLWPLCCCILVSKCLWEVCKL